MTGTGRALSLENVCVRAGSFALRDVTFRISSGSHFVLLGPPGSGKSVTAETVCGLRDADSGFIRIGAMEVSRTDPAQRNIGYVPQDYILLPQRTVARNLSLGLEARRVPRAERRQRVNEAAEVLGISHLLERRVTHLSGGERQRVALGRALIFRPHLLILDEPVSALDESTRGRLLTMLNDLQRAEGITMLHICHNLEEMMACADDVGVMRDGRIEQTGPRDEVLRRPSGRFVAEFMQAKNIFEAQAERAGTGSRVRIGLSTLLSDASLRGNVLAVVRPETVRLAVEGSSSAGRMPASARSETEMAFFPGADESGGPVGRVVALNDRGATVNVEVRGDVTWHATLGWSAFRELGLTVGQTARIVVRPEDVHLVDRTPENDR